MKLEILKENFKTSLSIVERVAGRNLSLPILNNILLKAEDNFLNLNSTDLETAIRLWILTKIIKKGEVVVPAKLLSNFVSSLPEEKISLEVQGKNLQIESKNFKTKIQGYSPEEFPIIPEFKNHPEYLEVKNKDFCQGLSQVVDMASSSQNRPEISGVYLSFSKNSIRMAATDSFRLAEKIIPLENSIEKDYAIIIPQKPAKEIINILEEKEGLLKVYFSTSQALFEFPIKESPNPEVQIISRLIEGEYPNYQDIIPKKFKTQTILEKEEFLNQIKIASLFSGKVNEVKVKVNNSKKEVEISSKNPDVGETNSTIKAKIEGDSVEASFNYKFLMEGLLKIKSFEVSFNLNNKEGPCVLKPVGDASYTYVVMPIKST